MSIKTPFRKGTKVTVTQGDEYSGLHSARFGLKAGTTAYDFDTDGDPTIVAVTEGRVTRVVQSQVGYGYYVEVTHKDGKDIYAHMRPGSIRVVVGQEVSPGQKLGIMGSSGNSTADHLHFERQEFQGGRWQSVAVDFEDDLSSGSYGRESWISMNESSENSTSPSPEPPPPPAIELFHYVNFSELGDIVKVDGIHRQSEIVFRDSRTGEIGMFTCGGNGIATEYRKIVDCGKENTVITTANIQGDINSPTEILLANFASKELFAYTIDGNGKAQNWIKVADMDFNSWQIVAVGNIDDDHMQEIIINRKGTGEIYAYHTDQQYGIARQCNYVGTIGEGTAITGCGDLNGDGRDEILMGGKAHNRSREIGVFQMNEYGLAAHYHRVGGIGANAQLVGAIDLDLNGTDEIGVRDLDTGNVGILLTDNFQAYEYREIADVGREVECIGVGDIRMDLPGQEFIFRDPFTGMVGSIGTQSSGHAHWSMIGTTDPATYNL